MRTRRSKYGNVRTNGFASKKEARRAQELQLLEKAGEIHDLKFQVRYPLVVNGQHVCTYVADAVYVERFGSPICQPQTVVEDVKSPASRTRLYLVKRSLMKALHGIEIREV